MKTKTQKGFTLVEVMVGTVAGAIVLLAAGTALVAGQTFWNKAWAKANLQRDASYAVLRISRSIRAGNSATVEDDGTALRIYTEGGWIRFSAVPDTKGLRLDYGNKGSETIHSFETILNGNLEDLEFTVEANRVGIDLKVKKDNLQNDFLSTVMMRNYGG